MNLKDVHNRTIAIVKMAERIQIGNPKMDPSSCLSLAKDFFKKAERFIDDEIKTNVGMGPGDFVKCIDNKVVDEGYTACEILEVGRTYQIQEVLESGMIVVDDFNSTIRDPFYPDRFEKVESGDSTENNN